MRDTLALVASDLIRKQLGAEIQVQDSSASARRTPRRGCCSSAASKRRRTARRCTTKATRGTQSRVRRRPIRCTAAAHTPTLDGPIPLCDACGAGVSTLSPRRRATPTLIRKWVDVGLPHSPIRRLRSIRTVRTRYEVRGNLRYWGWLSGDRDRRSQRAASLAAPRQISRSRRRSTRNQAGAYATLSHLYYQIPDATTSTCTSRRSARSRRTSFCRTPTSILSRLFLAAYDLGQFDKAKQWCDAAGQRFPGDVRAVKCRLYLLTTRIERAGT